MFIGCKVWGGIWHLLALEFGRGGGGFQELIGITGLKVSCSMWCFLL